MWLGVVTLFPDMINQATQFGVLDRGLRDGKLSLSTWDIRDYTKDKHRRVDDKPYGGGVGMLLSYPPVHAAICAAKKAAPQSSRTIYLSPQGPLLTQARLKGFAEYQSLIFVCGRYEGIDERLLQTDIDEECSIGDYVLSGGELAALVCIDALARTIPGVVGKAQSVAEDSFMNGLLDCAHYTRPDMINAMSVPAELLNGHHEVIRTWRLKSALGRTWLKRPDLLKERALSPEEKNLLAEFQAEYFLRLTRDK